MMLEWEEILLRLAVASVLGGLIGLERERKNWSAGLRTHMMVCVGSCLIMIVSMFGFHDVLGGNKISLDPSRVAAQVVSGIGFIGAGTILFQKKGIIRGLTTAAGLWTVAAIGLAVGGGLYFAAGITTGLALIILWAIQPLDVKYARRFQRQFLRIIMRPHSEEISLIEDILSDKYYTIETFNLDKSGENYVFNITFENSDIKAIKELIGKLKKMETVKEVSWSN